VELALTLSLLKYADTGDRRMAVLLPRELRAVLVACAIAIVAGTILASLLQLDFIPTLFKPQFVWRTAYFFQTQDRLWLVALAALLLCVALPPLPTWSAQAISIGTRTAIVVLALAVLVAGLIGTHTVFHGYHLTRDEFLAEFDAIIFRSGRFAAPIDATWRSFASALQPQFMLPVPPEVGFVSSYLPGNAAIRAVVGLIADDVWTSPLLATGAVLATFGVARRLWPNRRDAAFISALLVATSSQVLITSMTSYAMTAHLALNMIWLWLFLRDDKIGHGAALATGFLATGLHQVIFHPVFAAPFIVRLWESKRRALAAVYIAGYAAFCLFWIAYWKFALIFQGISPQGSDETGPVYFLARVLLLLDNFHWAGADLMLKNVLRFVAWQSPALIPLAALACPAIRRGTGIASELAAGLLLTVIAMFVLLPFQGHGWGYRYLHGLIGSTALLAGYGWVALSNSITQHERGACRTMLGICTLAAVLVLLPAHAMQARDFAMPYFRAARAIEQAPTDIVIVDKSRLLFAADLVRNEPFLKNRPKVLDLTYLTDSNIAELCAHYSISMFDYGQARAFGIMSSEHGTEFDDDVLSRARDMIARHGCHVVPVVRAGNEIQK
jgi:hypothetical protein